MKRSKTGFTLIELAIVVAIISVLAAIAIPNLLRARMTSNESAAISNLRTISASQVQFRQAIGRYAASFDELKTPPSGPAFLEGNWDIVKSGYTYALVGAGNDYAATSQPDLVDKSGTRAYFVDSSNLIRYVEGAGPADVTSLPLDE